MDSGPGGPVWCLVRPTTCTSYEILDLFRVSFSDCFPYLNYERHAKHIYHSACFPLISMEWQPEAPVLHMAWHKCFETEHWADLSSCCTASNAERYDLVTPLPWECPTIASLTLFSSSPITITLLSLDHNIFLFSWLGCTAVTPTHNRSLGYSQTGCPTGLQCCISMRDKIKS